MIEWARGGPRSVSGLDGRLGRFILLSAPERHGRSTSHPLPACIVSQVITAFVPEVYRLITGDQLFDCSRWRSSSSMGRRSVIPFSAASSLRVPQ